MRHNLQVKVVPGPGSSLRVGGVWDNAYLVCLAWLFGRFVSDHKTKLLCIAGDSPWENPTGTLQGLQCCLVRARLPQLPLFSWCSSSRVRIHDLRSDKIALSLSAHQLGVSAVQMDDWKIVSGGEEGLVSVWDYRMNQKLWEVHSR